MIIGVAGVVSVGLAMATTHGAVKHMYDALAGRAALEVTPAAGGNFSEDVAVKLAHLPGIAASVPSIQRPTILHHEGGKAKVLVMGIDPLLDSKVHDYDLLAGESLATGDGALLESSFARSLNIQLHDKIKLFTPRGLKTVKVVGLLAPRGVAGLSQGTAVFLRLSTAQKYFVGKRGIDKVQIVLQPGAKEENAQAEIARTLPENLTVHAPAGRTQQAEDSLNSLEQALRVAGASSLVLAVFIIINAFLMSVSERRKQWATMRAIGATRYQVLRIMMCEGLVLGTAGTALGVLVGIGGAFLLTRTMADYLQTNLPPIKITWQPPLFGAVLGILTTAASTYLPARRAGKISPLEGLRSISKFDVEPTPIWVTALGVLALTVGAAVIYATSQGKIEQAAMVTAGVICLFGCVMLLPLVIKPASGAATGLLRMVAPIEADLAQRQILRRRIRSTLTAAVLFIAVSVGIALGTTILDNVRDVNIWADHTFVGDYFVRAMMPDTSTGTSVDIPESLRDEFVAVPGVKEVAAARLARARRWSVGADPRQGISAGRAAAARHPRRRSRNHPRPPGRSRSRHRHGPGQEDRTFGR